MFIEHIAIWTENLEGMTAFYEKYFDGKRNEKYFNSKKNFESYFVKFDSGCRLEIMQMPTIPETRNDAYSQFSGIIHFAFDLKNKESIDLKTKELVAAGYELIDGPRVTGDGYYESVILDPDKNRVELTCLV
ncbi:MAG: VOC family protein [bacterium]|nr:VOC family protein [bacterium]